MREHLLREGVSGAAFLPPALALRKQVEDLPEQVRTLSTEAQVRLAVDRLNQRILDALRKPGEGPAVTVMAVDVELIVLGWRFARIARRQRGPAAEPADEPVVDEPVADAPVADGPGRTRRPRRWRRT